MSNVPAKSEINSDKTRNEIYLNFTKPEGAANCNLVINAGTTLWGSKMIKEMLSLYGNTLDTYYKKMNDGKEDYQAMMNYLAGEELYQLKLYVWSNNKWEYKTTINGGGPIKSETRVYPIDISDIAGKKLNIKLIPPVGFWTFDYTAVNFEQPVHPKSFTLKMKKAVDQNSNNLLSELISTDKSYYTMPDTKSYSYLSFDAPETESGKTRTIFASTSGWYDIHLPKTGTPDIAQLMSLGSRKGEIIKFSIKRYNEWTEQQRKLLGNK